MNTQQLFLETMLRDRVKNHPESDELIKAAAERLAVQFELEVDSIQQANRRKCRAERDAFNRDFIAKRQQAVR